MASTRPTTSQRARVIYSKPMTADTLIVNVKGITLDAANPRCEALAIRGERILYVGSEPEAMALRGAETQIIDGGGNSLIPGIIDSHFHLTWGALRLDDMALGEVRSLNDLAAAIARHRAAYPEAAVLRGFGLNYDILPGGARLTRQQLDAIEPARPLILTSIDFHTAWCNTAALAAAGLLHGAALPAHAEVVMAEDGLASGELREFEALAPVYALVPEPNEAHKRALLRRALQLANSYGITSIHNMNGDADEYARYRALDEAGELSLRVSLPWSFSPEMALTALEEAVQLGADYRSPRLKAGRLKLFLDGVVESFTALMLAPYPNNPATQGEALYSAERFAEIVTAADALGLQVAVHAIGDAAVRRALDGFARARQANGARDSRHRIEHIELLHPDDLARFSELGVIASMQPYHCSRPEVDYLAGYLAYLPPERYSDAFPWRALVAAGVPLCFGSDWPVVSMNPFLGLDAAVNRAPWRKGLPEAALSRLEALAAYTTGAAYAEFAEADKGQLKAGMLADMALLSSDLLALPAEQLGSVQVQLTLLGGKVCFAR